MCLIREYDKRYHSPSLSVEWLLCSNIFPRLRLRLAISGDMQDDRWCCQYDGFFGIIMDFNVSIK